MKYFVWPDRQSHPKRDADGRETGREFEPYSATSVHIGGGCGSVHVGEAGHRIEICASCAAPATAAGLRVEHIEDGPAPKATKKTEADA